MIDEDVESKTKVSPFWNPKNVFVSSRHVWHQNQSAISLTALTAGLMLSDPALKLTGTPDASTAVKVKVQRCDKAISGHDIVLFWHFMQFFHYMEN